MEETKYYRISEKDILGLIYYINRIRPVFKPNTIGLESLSIMEDSLTKLEPIPSPPVDREEAINDIMAKRDTLFSDWWDKEFKIMNGLTSKQLHAQAIEKAFESGMLSASKGIIGNIEVNKEKE